MNFKFGDALKPSSFNQWPTEEQPDYKYKFSSLVVWLDQEVTQIERSTYNVLEWLGDIGGLYDAMKLVGQAIVYPVAMFALKVELTTHAFGNQLKTENRPSLNDRKNQDSKTMDE